MRQPHPSILTSGDAPTAPPRPAERLAAFLGDDPVTAAILALPQAALDALLVNDAYKPRMHRLACLL